jgi:hypothetical protein
MFCSEACRASVLPKLAVEEQSEWNQSLPRQKWNASLRLGDYPVIEGPAITAPSSAEPAGSRATPENM